jgi:hypothetical protein
MPGRTVAGVQHYGLGDLGDLGWVLGCFYWAFGPQQHTQTWVGLMEPGRELSRASSTRRDVSS